MDEGISTSGLIVLIVAPLVLASIVHGSGRPGLARLVVILAIALWIKLLWPVVRPQPSVPAASSSADMNGEYRP
jgi:hypothetical protein